MQTFKLKCVQTQNLFLCLASWLIVYHFLYLLKNVLLADPARNRTSCCRLTNLSHCLTISSCVVTLPGALLWLVIEGLSDRQPNWNSLPGRLYYYRRIDVFIALSLVLPLTRYFNQLEWLVAITSLPIAPLAAHFCQSGVLMSHPLPPLAEFTKLITSACLSIVSL